MPTPRVPTVTSFTTLALIRTYASKLEAFDTSSASVLVRKEIEKALLALEEAAHLAEKEQTEAYLAGRQGSSPTSK